MELVCPDASRNPLSRAISLSETTVPKISSSVRMAVAPTHCSMASCSRCRGLTSSAAASAGTRSIGSRALPFLSSEIILALMKLALAPLGPGSWWDGVRGRAFRESASAVCLHRVFRGHGVLQAVYHTYDVAGCSTGMLHDPERERNACLLSVCARSGGARLWYPPSYSPNLTSSNRPSTRLHIRCIWHSADRLKTHDGIWAIARHQS